MKLRVEHDVFADAISWVAHTIPSRPSLPVLAGIRIEAFKDEASKSRVSRDLMGEAAGAEPDKKKK